MEESSSSISCLSSVGFSSTSTYAAEQPMTSAGLSLVLMPVDGDGILCPNDEAYQKAVVATAQGLHHCHAGEYDLAEPLLVAALALKIDTYGTQSPGNGLLADLSASQYDLAACYHQNRRATVDKWREAGKLYEDCVALRRQALGDSHPATVEAQVAYADLLSHRLGKVDTARL